MKGVFATSPWPLCATGGLFRPRTVGYYVSAARLLKESAPERHPGPWRGLGRGHPGQDRFFNRDADGSRGHRNEGWGPLEWLQASRMNR